MKVFLSIGSTANQEQEEFVQAVEARLRAEGMEPQTLGRTAWTAEAPLKGIRDLMDQCHGVLVIALERYYFPEGIERRGGDRETVLQEVLSSTAWNQIEASMGYTKALPLMVVVSEGVRADGLLEEGYDWYVQRVSPSADSLNTAEFNGVLASWKENVRNSVSEMEMSKDPGQMTIGQLLKSLRPAQLWSVLLALSMSLAAAFAIGTRFPPTP